MVKKAKQLKAAKKSKGGELKINLFGPGMTALHKAGLAGIRMTLGALEKSKGNNLKKHGSWNYTDTSVTLKWKGKPEIFFNDLFAKSFKIDKNGLIWFPALGEPMDNPERNVILHEAILNSFLQHGRIRKADKAADPQGRIPLEDKGHILRFHKLKSYVHQWATYSPIKSNPLAGWLFPGGAVRHVGLGATTTALEEPPDRALALRFAPIGAIYFEIHSRVSGVRPHYSLVIPEIRNLNQYRDARKCFLRYGAQELHASGGAEAGFRVLAELQASNLLGDVQSASCRVISFGTVPWSSQQKSRVNLMTVRAGSKANLLTFALCRKFLKPILVQRDKAAPFWDIPQMPDLVARNLIDGRRWWEGFADLVAKKDCRKHVFNYEKGGLAMIVEDKTAFPEGPERIFVLACQEAWRRRLGQLSEKAKRQSSFFSDQANREFERVRVVFSRCKNGALLREAVTDFWARSGGPLKTLQDKWQEILPLFNEKNWRLAKDLALLALASYKPADKKEAEALEASEKPQTLRGRKS